MREAWLIPGARPEAYATMTIREGNRWANPDARPTLGRSCYRLPRSGLVQCRLCRARHKRHEGACRLLADGVDIRVIQLMLGHASMQQTQRYLNVTDEELRKGLEVSWNNSGRLLRLATQEADLTPIL